MALAFLSLARHLRARRIEAPIPGFPERCSAMDKNRTEGAKNQVKGTVKEVAGKVTGNKTQELEGKAQKGVGKVQSAVGKAKDDARH